MQLPSFPFRCLYSGYVVSCLGDRLWAFAIIFVLEHLGGLRLVTINQLFQGVSGMLLSGYVGNWLDRHDRHFGVQAVLALNNLNVAISAALLAVCLSLNSNSGAFYIICLCLSILFCAFSNAAATGEKIAFTKDWVVVMATRDEKAILSAQNAILTMIDQLSDVFSPLFAGFILTYTGLRTSCFIFVGWNALAWLVESILLRTVYRAVPELATRIRASEDGTPLIPSVKPHKMVKIYLRQKVFPAAFALALLYLTVLAFDGISVSYGKTEGLTENILGAFQSVGSAMGMIGAISYTVIERRFGVRKVGLIGLLAELVFLSFAIASIWLPGSPFDPIFYFKNTTFSNWLKTFLDTFSVDSGAKNNPNNSGVDWSNWTVAGHSVFSLFSLYVGMALSRYGLWVADLSITQIMQESVAETERGTVFGVENALCMLFSVCKDLMAIMLPNPKTFGILILISFFTVFLGFLQYLYFLLVTNSTEDRNKIKKDISSSSCNIHL